MDIQDVIVREIVVPVSQQQAWAAVSEPEQLSRWFGSTCRGTVAVGEIIFFEWGDEHLSRARIEAIEPLSRFAYSWHPGSEQFLDLPFGEMPVTLVEFLLEPVADGTRITLRESGFAALPDSVRGTATEENIGGWAEEMDHLAAYLNGETQG